MDPVLDHRFAKVDYQRKPQVQQAQVGKGLRFEYGMVLGGRFALDDNLVCNH